MTWHQIKQIHGSRLEVGNNTEYDSNMYFGKAREDSRQFPFNFNFEDLGGSRVWNVGIRAITCTSSGRDWYPNCDM